MVLKIGSYCVALAILKLSEQTRLGSKSQGSISLCLSSTGVPGMYYHIWFTPIFLQREEHRFKYGADNVWSVISLSYVAYD